jgi:hypothetical protein
VHGQDGRSGGLDLWSTAERAAGAEEPAEAQRGIRGQCPAVSYSSIMGLLDHQPPKRLHR